MSISYEEALATLQAMFSEPWTRDSLDAVLRHFQGHMENTVDALLSHGDKAPQVLINRLKSGESAAEDATALDEQLARQLSQGQTAASGNGSNTPAASGGGSSTAAAAAQKNGRGTPTTLPDDFLRVPNFRSASNAAGPSTTNATATSQSTLDADEALARMLQDELFSEELARNPDFAHLAGRRPPSGGQQQRQPAPNPAVPNRSGIWPGGFPARNGQQQQQQPQINVLEKLSEMGSSAKNRLALMAAQFKANNANRNAAAGGGGGFLGGGQQPRSEMRGLLDGDDTDAMELASRKEL